MKKRFLILIFFLIFTNCSFDNKSGIWTDNKERVNKKKQIENNKYQEIFNQDQIYNEEKKTNTTIDLLGKKPIQIINWNSEFFSINNNTPNIKLSNNGIRTEKSRKLGNTKKHNNFLIGSDGNIISYDHNGVIFLYSPKLEKKIFEFNFYKKQFKKYNKIIYLTLNDNIVYAADNLGYLYALDIKNQKLLWAKNFGIPFRSNIHIHEKQIFLANQDNTVFGIKAENGLKNLEFSTTQTPIKSSFVNNLGLDNDKNLYFLNTSGELYSINYENENINWVVNLNSLSLSVDLNIFDGTPLVIKDDSIFVSTKNSFVKFSLINAQKIWIKPIANLLKPVIVGNYAFLATTNKLIICQNIDSGEIIWSSNLDNLLNSSKKNYSSKIKKLKKILIINNQINLFSENGYQIILSAQSGSLKDILKISKKNIKVGPIIFNNKMLYLNKNNRIITIE